MNQEQAQLFSQLTQPAINCNQLINYDELLSYFPNVLEEQMWRQLLKNYRKAHKHELVHRWQKFDTQILLSAIERHQKNWHYINDKLFPWMNIRQLKNRYYQIMSSGHKESYIFRENLKPELDIDINAVIDCIRKCIQ